MPGPMPAELAGILNEIAADGGHATGATGAPGAFGHRQHVHLAFIAARRYGTAGAADRVGDWIRHLTAHAPHRYHATVTRAWAEIVGHHVARDPSAGDFAVFIERHPALLDKRLLLRHYSSRVLASPGARNGWVEPDLAPFPWRPATRRPGQPPR
jgi:hypothetical protein